LKRALMNPETTTFIIEATADAEVIKAETTEES
jgi:hypothetical protein